jgi:hypothetical protein
LSTKSAAAPEKRESSLRLPRATRLIAARSFGLDDFQWTMFAPSVLWTETELSFGGVASYWNPNEVEELLPARSVQPPETPAAPLSGPAYVSELHAATPEVASVPVQLIATGWLYQPFASGGRAALADKSVGGWLSILIGLVVVEGCDPPTSVTVHVLVVPVVGPSTLTPPISHPELLSI